MTKILRYVLMTVMALCFTVAAEAASVALLPLINNVKGDEIAGQVYYNEAISTLNAAKGFVLVENDQVTAAIEAAKIGSKVPDEATLRKIAREGDVDIVIAMQLDKLDDTYVPRGFEDKMVLTLEGYCVSYNRLNGKFMKHRIYSDTDVTAATVTRWDWTHEEWGKAVDWEIDHVLRGK